MSENLQYLVPFAEREEGWYLYFPLGEVYHGGTKVDFTEDRAREMVANFNEYKVPDYDLPINMLHNDSQGVFGYIGGLRFANSEVQWKPNFRPEKVEEIQDKGFKYCSPEVWFNGYQAKDGKKFDNVAVGVALTPRPRLGRATALFSENEGWALADPDTPEGEAAWEINAVTSSMHTLRFLKRVEGMEQVATAALEAMKAVAHKVVDVFDDKTDKDDVGGTMSDIDTEKISQEVSKSVGEKITDFLKGQFKEPEPKQDPEPKDFSAELEAQRVEMAEEIAKRDAELAEMAEAKAQAEAQVKEFNDKLAEEQNKRRLAEFEDKAKELNVPVANFAETLMYFNDADNSEGKTRYAQMVAVIEAMGNAERMAELFAEKGTDATQSKTPAGRLETLIAARVTETGESRAKATEVIAHSHPELYSEYSRSVTTK